MKVPRDRTEDEVTGILEKVRRSGLTSGLFEGAEGQAPPALLTALEILVNNPESDTAIVNVAEHITSCHFSTPDDTKRLFDYLREDLDPSKADAVLQALEIVLRNRDEDLIFPGDFFRVILRYFPHPTVVTILSHLVDSDIEVFELLQTHLERSPVGPHSVRELIKQSLTDSRCFSAGFTLLRTALSYKSLFHGFIPILYEVSEQIPFSHADWQIGAFGTLDYLCESKAISEEWCCRPFVSNVFNTIDLRDELLLCGLKFARNLGRVIDGTLEFQRFAQIHKPIRVAVERGNVSCIRVGCEMICDSIRSSKSDGVTYWLDSGILHNINAKRDELSFVCHKRFIECVAQVINYGPRECIETVCSWKVTKCMLDVLDSEISDAKLQKILIHAVKTIIRFKESTPIISEDEIYDILESDFDNPEADQLAHTLCN